MFKQGIHSSGAIAILALALAGSVFAPAHADDQERRFAKGSPSDHPSLSPEATLFVTDADISKREGVAGIGEAGVHSS